MVRVPWVLARLPAVPGFDFPDEQTPSSQHAPSELHNGVWLLAFDDSRAFLNSEELVGGDIDESLHLLRSGQIYFDQVIPLGS